MSYRRGSDQVRHEIVFRATRHPVSCYRIRLTSAASTAQQKTQCEVFDCNFEPVPFDLVPITDDAAEDASTCSSSASRSCRATRAPVTLRGREGADNRQRTTGNREALEG